MGAKGKNNRLFGTDGIRGIANLELTPDLAMRVGSAAVRVLAREGSRPFFILGRDTRISGSMLESALTAGICSAGGSVEVLGVIPTPAVAFLTRKKAADAGIVISASHNPAEDNGIKFFGCNGFKLPDEVELRMESIIMAGEAENGRPGGAEVGHAKPSIDAAREYLDYLLSVSRPDLSGMRIVIDCANGAVYSLAPMLLEACGARVIAMNTDPDGLNINLECGSTHPESLMETVLKEEADLGLAYDGDADRMLAVDEKGNMVDGDFVMAICATHLKARGGLKGNALVTTVMTNLGFHNAMRREGIEVHQTQVGDRYVLEKMIELGLNLGGEQSGHVIFLDHATTGDGLVTTLLLLESLVASEESLSSLRRIMERVPQLLINVRVKDKESLSQSAIITEAMRRWEEKLGGGGRILLRPSGTESVVRVMVEDLDSARAENAARELAAVIQKEMG
ncbi:MAG: phosphoglucosamine mutase [Candidatus Solincola sediminis]|nr:MAG: phosphoglucosamine mutase [Candidatus Solincola sediminis]